MYSIKANIIAQFLYNSTAGCRLIEDSINHVLRQTPPYIERRWLKDVDYVEVHMKDGRVARMSNE